MKCLQDKEYVTFPDCENCDLLEGCIHASEGLTSDDPRVLVMANRTFGVEIPLVIFNGTIGWRTENCSKLLLCDLYEMGLLFEEEEPKKEEKKTEGFDRQNLDLSGVRSLKDLLNSGELDVDETEEL